MPEKKTGESYRSNLDDSNPGFGWYEVRMFEDGKWTAEAHVNTQNVPDGREESKELAQKRLAGGLRKLADALDPSKK